MKYKYKNMEKVLIHNHDWKNDQIFLGFIRGYHHEYNYMDEDIHSWIVQWISKPKKFEEFDCAVINEHDLTPLSTED